MFGHHQGSDQDEGHHVDESHVEDDKDQCETDERAEMEQGAHLESRPYAEPGGYGKQTALPVEIRVLTGIENIKPGDVGQKGQGQGQDGPVKAAGHRDPRPQRSERDAESQVEMGERCEPFGEGVRKENAQDRKREDQTKGADHGRGPDKERGEEDHEEGRRLQGDGPFGNGPIGGPWIPGIVTGIHDPVESHGRGACPHHGHQDPEQQGQGEGMLPVGEQNGRKSKGHGKDRVAEFDHPSEGLDTPQQPVPAFPPQGASRFQQFPGTQGPFQIVAQFVENDPEKAHADNTGEHAIIGGPPPCIHDEKAEPPGGGEGLHEEEHGNTRTRADPKGGETVGQGHGDQHMPQGLPGTSLHGSKGVQVFLVHPQDPVPGGHQDLIPCNEGNHGNLRTVSQPQQEKKDRKEDDFGDGIGQKNHGGNQAVQLPG